METVRTATPSPSGNTSSISRVASGNADGYASIGWFSPLNRTEGPTSHRIVVLGVDSHGFTGDLEIRLIPCNCRLQGH